MLFVYTMFTVNMYAILIVLRVNHFFSVQFFLICFEGLRNKGRSPWGKFFDNTIWIKFNFTWLLELWYVIWIISTQIWDQFQVYNMTPAWGFVQEMLSHSPYRAQWPELHVKMENLLHLTELVWQENCLIISDSLSLLPGVSMCVTKHWHVCTHLCEMTFSYFIQTHCDHQRGANF